MPELVLVSCILSLAVWAGAAALLSSAVQMGAPPRVTVAAGVALLAAFLWILSVFYTIL